MAAPEIEPADFRGLHAVAHVMEMQGRPAEGVDLVDKHERYFPGDFLDAGLTLPSHLKRLSSIRTPDPSYGHK